MAKIRLRPNLCQMDATLGLVGMSGRKPALELQMLGSLATRMGGAGAAIADLLDAWVPVMELSKGHTHAYSMEALRDHGVPQQCLAVLICERRAPDGTGGRALTVLDVDHATDRIVFMENGKLRKTGADLFMRAVHPRVHAGVTTIARPLGDA
jgi:hypothetical protein